MNSWLKRRGYCEWLTAVTAFSRSCWLKAPTLEKNYNFVYSQMNFSCSVNAAKATLVLTDSQFTTPFELI